MPSKICALRLGKFFVSGGDAMPNRIRSAFASIYGRKICSGYKGLSEASPTVAVNMANNELPTDVVSERQCMELNVK